MQANLSVSYKIIVLCSGLVVVIVFKLFLICGKDIFSHSKSTIHIMPTLLFPILRSSESRLLDWVGFLSREEVRVYGWI
jgi:hypothetical protein